MDACTLFLRISIKNTNISKFFDLLFLADYLVTFLYFCMRQKVILWCNLSLLSKCTIGVHRFGSCVGHTEMDSTTLRSVATNISYLLF